MYKTISTVLLTSSLALGLGTTAMANPESSESACAIINPNTGECVQTVAETQAQSQESQGEQERAASLILGQHDHVFQIDEWPAIRALFCNQCKDSDPEDPPIDVIPDPEEPSQDVPEPATVLSLLAIAGFGGLGLKRRT